MTKITDKGMILVHEATMLPAQLHEEVTDFRGDKAILTGGYAPAYQGTTGRVLVSEDGIDGENVYYPSVYNLKWIEEEKQL